MDKEGHNIDLEGLRLIASLADGSLRDALSMTEQILSASLPHYSQEFVAKLLGVVSESAVKDICSAVLAGTVEPAFEIVKDVYEKGFDLCQLMDAMTERFRVLSLAAHVEEKKVSVIIPSLVSEDFLVAQKYEKADLKRLFAMAIDGMAQVFSAQKPIFALELFILRAALRPPISDAVTINYCLQKLDAIMNNRPLPNQPEPSGNSSASPARSAHGPFFEGAQAKRREDALEAEASDRFQVKSGMTAQSGSTNSQNLVEQFSTLLQNLKRNLPILASHLRHARPKVDKDKGILHLSFEQSLHFEQVMAHKTNEHFKNTITSVFGQNLSISLELAKQPSSSMKEIKTVAEADEQKKLLEEKTLYDRARESPLVKKALEIFGGDITEVKKIKTHIPNVSDPARLKPS